MAIGTLASLAAACGGDTTVEAVPASTTSPEPVTTTTIPAAAADDKPKPNELAAWHDEEPFIEPVALDDLWLSPGAGGPDSQQTGFLINLGGCLGLLPYPEANPVPVLIGGNGKVEPNVVELLDGGTTIALGGQNIKLGTFVALGGASYEYPAEAPDEAPPTNCPVADAGVYFAAHPLKAVPLDEYDPEFHGPFD